MGCVRIKAKLKRYLWILKKRAVCVFTGTVRCMETLNKRARIYPRRCADGDVRGSVGVSPGENMVARMCADDG